MIDATILTIAYGIRIGSRVDDLLIVLAAAASHLIIQAAVLPLTSLMDIFPAFKYIPKRLPGKSSFFCHVKVNLSRIVPVTTGGSFERKVER